MKWLRNILKGVSLTAALFVFQACYGAPQVPEYQEEQEQAVVQDPEESGDDATKAAEEVEAPAE